MSGTATLRGMTQEHRLDAALVILADARGPLTPRELAGRLTALGHACPRAAARRLLERLAARGLAERYDLVLAGFYPARIYWPTELGRRDAEQLERSPHRGA